MYIAPAPRWRRRLGVALAVLVVLLVVGIEAVILRDAAEVHERGERVVGSVVGLERSPKGSSPIAARVAVTVDGLPMMVEITLDGVRGDVRTGDPIDVLYLREGTKTRFVAAEEDVGARMISNLPFVVVVAFAGLLVGAGIAGLRFGRRP